MVQTSWAAYPRLIVAVAATFALQESMFFDTFQRGEGGGVEAEAAEGGGSVGPWWLVEGQRKLATNQRLMSRTWEFYAACARTPWACIFPSRIPTFYLQTFEDDDTDDEQREQRRFDVGVSAATEFNIPRQRPNCGRHDKTESKASPYTQTNSSLHFLHSLQDQKVDGSYKSFGFYTSLSFL